MSAKPPAIGASPLLVPRLCQYFLILDGLPGWELTMAPYLRPWTTTIRGRGGDAER
jgi:hypothetical protein